ncbi:MAG: molybdopterin-dependent oxidoreductase [Chloroflexi bacterium]|nr:molybdopterin-dependent oxidoreductase [Chloroflexota bacterium]
MNKHPRFIFHSQSPINGGVPLDLLAQSFITPTELFFVRTHAPAPMIDPERYRLRVDGLVKRKIELSLDEIKNNFPPRTLNATLQCAGNRRAELNAIAPVPNELPWGAEAIGNATWRGIALQDILAAASARDDASHVAFSGLDQIEKEGHTFSFGGSIPIIKAREPNVLLAYEMNGAPLAPIHGFPLRVIAPGYVGARSVKWLAHITVQKESSSNYFQTRAYQLFPANMRAENLDWTTGLQLSELNVNSVICEPTDGARLQTNFVLVRGYAISSRALARVEITLDNGANWISAEMLGTENSDSTWRLWRARVDLKPGRNEIAVRAWDSAANTQPANLRDVWNFKGYMNNAWHRINIFRNK